MELKICLNCGNSYTSCNELICRWHEAYVSTTEKCPWFVKKVEEKKNSHEA